MVEAFDMPTRTDHRTAIPFLVHDSTKWPRLLVILATLEAAELPSPCGVYVSFAVFRRITRTSLGVANFRQFLLDSEGLQSISCSSRRASPHRIVV